MEVKTEPEPASSPEAETRETSDLDRAVGVDNGEDAQAPEAEPESYDAQVPEAEPESYDSQVPEAEPESYDSQVPEPEPRSSEAQVGSFPDTQVDTYFAPETLLAEADPSCDIYQLALVLPTQAFTGAPTTNQVFSKAPKPSPEKARDPDRPAPSVNRPGINDGAQAEGLEFELEEDEVPISRPPPPATDHALTQRLRRIFKVRMNGEYLKGITAELLEMFEDTKGGGREKIKLKFEKCGYSPDRVLNGMCICPAHQDHCPYKDKYEY